jgi:hypothetical protein
MRDDLSTLNAEQRRILGDVTDDKLRATLIGLMIRAARVIKPA